MGAESKVGVIRFDIGDADRFLGVQDPEFDEPSEGPQQINGRIPFHACGLRHRASRKLRLILQEAHLGVL